SGSLLQTRRGRLPPRGKPSLEQVPGLRFDGPDGDRRHGSKSAGVEGQVAAFTPRHQDIVGVLILGKNLFHTGGRRVTAEPTEHAVETGQGLALSREPLTISRRQPGPILQRHHELPLASGCYSAARALSRRPVHEHTTIFPPNGVLGK